MNSIAPEKESMTSAAGRRHTGRTVRHGEITRCAVR